MSLLKINKELIAKYKAGDKSVANRLYLCNRNMIMKIASEITNKHFCTHLYDDLYSAGVVVFLEQLDRFDETKGLAFSTFLYPHLKWAMYKQCFRDKLF